MNLRTITVCFLLIFTLQGCSSYSTKTHSQTLAITPQSSTAHDLLAQHSKWEGTPYQLGGNSREGIDCSAYTKITYQKVFGLNLPRTTIDQVTTGENIQRRNLAPGDLIFFRTGSKQRHVGVYVEQGLFMHASTSKGVTLSRLDNPYWHQHYWKSIRPHGK